MLLRFIVIHLLVHCSFISWFIICNWNIIGTALSISFCNCPTHPATDRSSDLFSLIQILMFCTKCQYSSSMYHFLFSGIWFVVAAVQFLAETSLEAHWMMSDELFVFCWMASVSRHCQDHRIDRHRLSPLSPAQVGWRRRVRLWLWVQSFSESGHLSRCAPGCARLKEDSSYVEPWYKDCPTGVYVSKPSYIEDSPPFEIEGRQKKEEASFEPFWTFLLSLQ